MIRMTRRTLLQWAGSAVSGYSFMGSAGIIGGARAEDRFWRHGISLFDDLKYPAEFVHFDYVNPQAPKGGTVRQGASGTYDNFNAVVAGLKGDLAAGIDLVFETLLTPSLDEPSADYGLLAEVASYPPDFSSVTYRLRREAKWHDGEPVTPEDVIFSFDAFKQNNPQIAAYYRRVTKAERTGDRDVTFIFAPPFSHELPQIVGQLTIMPKHWWMAANASGQPRDVANTTLEKPLGSGPYRIKEFEPGRFVVYERVADHWARDLNVNVGQNNFAELRFDYFRDLSVEFEAFKADQFDWHVENRAKNWATEYDFPAVKDRNVVLEQFPIRNVGIMQAFTFNTRRAKFRDSRLRRAFNFAFDFEKVNDELFYGEYKRIASYFEGTELAATGLPHGRELEFLETLRDQVPPEVFTTPYWNPVAGGEAAARANLLEAMLMLESAGYVVRNLKLIDPATNGPLAVEFLLADPSYEGFVLFYKGSLERLGIEVTVRAVGDVEYVNRLRQWDFDIIVASWTESLSPGNEQRNYWGSRAATTPGSRNLVGIMNPAIDALIDHIVFASSRADLVAATKALDRVLLWNNYVVPQWSYGKVRTARWDRFGRPDPMPVYGGAAFPKIWWWDAEHANNLESQR
jgi:microcin C transport system substrate-binding protein